MDSAKSPPQRYYEYGKLETGVWLGGSLCSVAGCTLLGLEENCASIMGRKLSQLAHPYQLGESSMMFQDQYFCKKYLQRMPVEELDRDCATSEMNDK